MNEGLALYGGKPVREALLPYGRQWVDEEDIAAVTRALRSDWLTTGPWIEAFEAKFARLTNSPFAVSLNSGTAALHACMHALGIGAGDEVIVPALTFAASANAVVFQGATPVFADVEPDTLLLGPEQVAARLTPRTRAVVAVDYAGQPCDYQALREVTEKAGVYLVADACHALGASYQGRPVGSLADVSAFSLHPVKPVTTGEGGIVTTGEEELAEKIRRFRNHGINRDHRQRQDAGSWYYEMVELGYNYRLTDFQSALGLSQLDKLAGWLQRRREIAARYDAALQELPGIRPLARRPERCHAFHLYVVQLELAALNCDRATVFAALRAEGIGVNVHYLPVHLHLYYRRHLGTGPGLCPVAEAAYERILTLPLFPAMTDREVEEVIVAVGKVMEAYRR